MLKETKAVKGQELYKSIIPYDHLKELEWEPCKKVLDDLFQSGFITFDEWLFCIVDIRKKLGLINVL